MNPRGSPELTIAPMGTYRNPISETDKFNAFYNSQVLSYSKNPQPNGLQLQTNSFVGGYAQKSPKAKPHNKIQIQTGGLQNQRFGFQSLNNGMMPEITSPIRRTGEQTVDVTAQNQLNVIGTLPKLQQTNQNNANKGRNYSTMAEEKPKVGYLKQSKINFNQGRSRSTMHQAYTQPNNNQKHTIKSIIDSTFENTSTISKNQRRGIESPHE